MSETSDLIQFLLDPRIKIVSTALDLLLGMTATNEGNNTLLSHLKPLSKNLHARYLMNDSLDEKILSILVNISGAELDENKVVCLVQLICKGIPKQPRQIELLSMLLANITTSEQGCIALCSGDRSKFLVPLLSKLLESPETSPAVVADADAVSDSSLDPFRYLASVLMNVTRTNEGRLLVLRQILEESPMSAPSSPSPSPSPSPTMTVFAMIVRQLESSIAVPESEPPLRRLGAAGTLKNLLMAVEEAEDAPSWILDLFLADHEILRTVLKSISGASPLVQPEALVRQAVAEALYFLTQSKRGRDALWQCDGPEAMRKGYELEVHPGVCNAMEMFAQEILKHSEIESALANSNTVSDVSGDKCCRAA